MTAINVVCSRKHQRIWIATDAVAYDDNGVIASFESKVTCIPKWSCAVMNRGAVNASELVAAAALETFSGFSDMVAGIGDELPRIIGRSALFAPFELILAGFSTKRAEPQCWFIQTPGSPSGPGYPQPYRIQRFPNVMVGPTPSSEIQAAAGYELISENAEPDAVVPCLGQILEMQRHSKFDGLHWVGGFGELTTLTPDNIEQRRLQLWPEDRVGERIQPKAIEWSEWKCM